MTSTGNYHDVAEQTLTNDEPDNSPVTEFVASVFELADDFTALEADVAGHELGRGELTRNGLEDLDARFKSLTARFTDVQRVVADPEKLSEHSSTDGFNVDDDDATRLREAIHGFADLDRVLGQIRDTQTRVGNDITAKRSHLTTMRGLYISVVSSIVAAISLILTSANLLWM